MKLGPGVTIIYTKLKQLSFSRRYKMVLKRWKK